jgi:signal transduction histidine kinase
MFTSVRRRLALSYAAIFTVSLLLLGPILYLTFASQLAAASDATLRLAAQRQAILAYVPSNVQLGINPYFTAPASLANSNNFYLLLNKDGTVQANTVGVQHAGLPDEAAVRAAVRQGHGIFSTLATSDEGDYRLYTVVIKKQGRVEALLQAGQPLAPLYDAQRRLAYLLLALGAGAVVIATIGGVWLTRQAMRPINAAFASQRAFIADASHELRTPLTLMRTNVEVLLEAGATPEPEDRALLEDVVAEAGHMGRLIADLLVLARLDAGALPLTRTPVDLSALVATTTRQVERVASRQGVAVRQGETDPVTVRGDSGRLEQVLLILLDNAVKYSDPGGVVEVTLRRKGGHAALTVRDTGPGIPASELPRLFARFHRSPGVGARTEGSGLGLAIAQGIVQAHNGRLRVRSIVGEGTAFTVLLPLSGAREASRRVRLTGSSVGDGRPG